MASRTGSSTDTRSGWAGLFWQAFTGSRNGMLLVDDQRRIVDANGAFVQLLGYTRRQLLARPIYSLAPEGPLLNNAEWRALLDRPHSSGIVELMTSGRELMTVELAVHPETVTGRRLVLAVASVATRSGRRRTTTPIVARSASKVLTERERQVIHLIALGHAGPEIADELHLSHNTVRSHIHNAMNKLGARSRAQLVAIVLGDGHAFA